MAVGRTAEVESIHLRWPDHTTTRELFKTSQAHYVVADKQTLPFYTSATTPAAANSGGAVRGRSFFRHEYNNRQQDAVLEKYITSICEDGHVPSVRGLPWAVCAAYSLSGPFYLMSYATLTEAIYEAHALHPNNKNVIDSITDGLENVILLSSDVPKDVLQWIKKTHNAFHHGADTNVMDILDDISQAHSSLTLQRESGKVAKTSRGDVSGYQRAVQEFLAKNYPKLPYNVFKRGRAFIATMERLNLYQEFKDTAARSIDFLDKQLTKNTDTV